jgi:hypothetical protein
MVVTCAFIIRGVHTTLNAKSEEKTRRFEQLFILIEFESNVEPIGSLTGCMLDILPKWSKWKSMDPNPLISQ